MAGTLRKSYQGVNFLFILNWDFLLSFGITALALAGGAFLASL
ncbi:MAG: hypothetical protein Tsb0024_07510 [Ruegeria sp.]